MVSATGTEPVVMGLQACSSFPKVDKWIVKGPGPSISISEYGVGCGVNNPGFWDSQIRWLVECCKYKQGKMSTFHAKDEYVLKSPEDLGDTGGRLPFAIVAVSRGQPSAVTCSCKPGLGEVIQA